MMVVVVVLLLKIFVIVTMLRLQRDWTMYV
jgi:hypothetical protein